MITNNDQQLQDKRHSSPVRGAAMNGDGEILDNIQVNLRVIPKKVVKSNKQHNSGILKSKIPKKY